MVEAQHESTGRAQKLIKRQKGPYSPSQPSPASPNDSLTTSQSRGTVNMPAVSLTERASLFRSKSVVANKGSGLSAAYGSSNGALRASSSSLWPLGWRRVLRHPSRRFSQATIGTPEETEERFSSPIDFELSLSPGWELLPIPHVSPLQLDFENSLQPTLCVADDARQEETGQRDVAASRDILLSSSSTTVAASRPPTGGKKRHKFTLHLDDELEFEESGRVEGVTDSVGICREVSGSMISPPSFHFHLPSRLNLNIASPQVSSTMPPASPTSTIRPSMTRRPAGFGPQPGTSRRYTFAMAMTDEGITDEALVRELERIRAIRTLSSASPSRAGSHTNLSNLPTTHIPENEDIDDVWDLDSGQSDVDVTSEDIVREDQEKEIISSGQVICESPSSERSHQWTQDLANALPAPPPISSPRSSSIPRSGRSALELSSRSASSKEPAATWHTTRHALLTCRELVRTERHYLSSLLSLLSCETSSQPPPLMLHYAAVLVKASATLVEKMEKSPTPSGVSKAFATMEPDLEAAYIGWCGVVGSWFVDGDQSKGLLIPEKSIGERSRSSLRRLSKVRASIIEDSSSRKPVSSWKGGFEAAVPHSTITTTRSRSTVSTASGSSNASCSSHSHSSSSSSSHSTAATSPSSSVSGCSGGTAPTSVSTSPGASKSSIVPVATANPPQRPSLLRKGQTASAPPSRVPSFSGTFDLEELTRLYSMPALSDKALSSKPPRKPSVRDLAILPTQRIMRYVLLFKDLESSTPYSSSSRFAVERAAGVADRLAKKCDRAQNNAAFIVSPPPIPVPNPVEIAALAIPPTPVVSPTIPRTTPTVRLVAPHPSSTTSLPVPSKALPVLPEDLVPSKDKGKEKDKPKTLPRKLTKRSRAPLSLHTRRKSELGYDIQEDVDAAFSPSDTVSIYTSSEHGHGVPASASHVVPLPSLASQPSSTRPLDVMSDDETSRRWRSQSHTNLASTQRIRASRRTSMISWSNAFSWLGSDKGPSPPSAYSSVDLVTLTSSAK